MTSHYPADFSWPAFDEAMDGEGTCPRCDAEIEDGECSETCGWVRYEPDPDRTMEDR